MFSADLEQVCRQVLEDFATGCPGLTDAAVCTRDGAELARLGASNSKTAVMSGTMRALGEAMAREAQLDDCHSVLIEGETGNLVIVPVHDVPGAPLVLAAVSNRQTSLGLLLAQSKHSSHMIGDLWQAFAGIEEEASHHV